MPIIQRFTSSRIVLHAGDHLLPHGHVKLNDGRECTVELDSLSITGRVLVREIRQELEWIQMNRQSLHMAWQRYNP